MKTLVKQKVAVGIIISIGLLVVACTSAKVVNNNDAIDGIAKANDEIMLDKSGAQLWGESCNRCHIAPSPADYNDTDWETIMLHMRVRANLTESEVTQIEEFLKSAN